MVIHFTRDSVCMGDDCFENSRDYTFDNNTSWDEIMPVIKKDHFIASVAGNNVVWVLINTEKTEILTYFTFIDKVIKCSNKLTLKDICGNSNSLHFKYYTSPQKRGEYILKVNNESEYNIWHDGWLEEYKLCKR